MTPPILPTTPPMTFFVDGESPELPEPPLLSTSPGTLDDAAAASTTLLAVETLLYVLLPLTEMMVVRMCCVTLLVSEEDGVDDV